MFKTIYEKATGLVVWAEKVNDERLAELDSLGYGITDAAVTEPWAKPVFNPETGEITNAATTEEQAVYQHQFEINTDNE